MHVVGEYSYRNAKGILADRRGKTVGELYSLLNDDGFRLRLGAEAGKKQDLSKQIQRHFAQRGWKQEVPTFTLTELRYDLVKEDVPIEVEIGHERLVYADFFKFLADYSQRKIPAGVMVVTENPMDFGHKWHNSRDSTRRKIEAISNVYFVPILVLGIQP